MTTFPTTTDVTVETALSEVSPRAAGVLTVDLAAIAENYRRLKSAFLEKALAAVVKADGYGLGAERVAPVLVKAGARSIFVAQLDEALELRPLLDRCHPAVALYVLNGLMPGAEADYAEHNILPVLNSLGEIDAWTAFCRARGTALPAAVHLDSGMCRLGLPPDEVEVLRGDPERLAGLVPTCILSHLACADEPGHPMNAEQLAALKAALTALPRAPVSFCNSSGIFLGRDYHFDLGRPGVALYGVNPTPEAPSPVQPVVQLRAKILQVRQIDAPQSVGYGATHRATGPARIATVAAGYADGYLRSISNRGHAWVAGHQVPVVGRVSMDLLALDVTGVAPDAVRPGLWAELLNGEQDVDALAREAGTIGYEILTSLGARYHRVYLD
ncbi:alanine racemase [Pelagibius marinus]|uniref:alanine racemase n=1 Tax=Pelagibius marinus TaxID=2762760 RepID=UPI0018731C05|nr:alanine racemase [Pelagibius marinus]